MGKNKTAKMPRDVSAFVRPYRVSDSHDFHLKRFSTDEKDGLDKEAAQKILDVNRERLTGKPV